MKFLNSLSVLKLASAALVVVLSGCSQGGGGNSGGTVATTPQACTANNTSNCSPVYPNGSGYIQPFNNNGYFSCPQNYILVSGWSTGPACMPIGSYNQFYNGYRNQFGASFYVYFTTGAYAYNTYYYGGVSNPAVTNMPQMTYSQPNAAISCDVRLQNSCGSAAQCQPVTGGSSLGLCVSTTGAAAGQSCYYNSFYRSYTCTYSNYGYGFINGGTR